MTVVDLVPSACTYQSIPASRSTRTIGLQGRRGSQPLRSGAAFVAHGFDAIPNDGVSTVESSIFGEFMGCYPADHLDQVGQVKDEGTDEDTGFNFQRLYLHIAEDLATERPRQLVGPVDSGTGLHTTVFRSASY